MIVYVGIYLFLAISCFVFQEGKQQSVWLYVCFFLLFIFSGFRLETGCDFWGYLQRFKYFNTDVPPLEYLREPEGGFHLLMYYVKSSGFDYLWLNVACAFIFLNCLKQFVDWNPNPILLLTIMFPILILQLSMSGLRQALAVAFLMLSLVAFIKGKKLLVGAFILVGATFHQSLIIFLPLVFMVGKELSIFRVMVALLTLGPVAAFMSSERMEVYGSRYLSEGSPESSGALLRLGLMLITAVLFELYQKKYKALFIPRGYELMRLFSLMTFSLIPITIISSVAVHRLSYYILPVQLFTLAVLPYAVSSSPKDQQVVKLLALALYGAYITIWFSFSKHATYCYIPYQSYLF